MDYKMETKTVPHPLQLGMGKYLPVYPYLANYTAYGAETASVLGEDILESMGGYPKLHPEEYRAYYANKEGCKCIVRIGCGVYSPKTYDPIDWQSSEVVKLCPDCDPQLALLGGC